MKTYGQSIVKGLAAAAVFAAAFAAALLFRSLAVEKVQVAGNSMEPTYRDGEVLLVSRLDRSPERGEVVVADTETGWIVKRAAGLPGDTVEIRGGKVFVNGSPEEGGFPETGPDMTVRLGEDEVFLLGDNRPESGDSRETGPVPLERIVGTAADQRPYQGG